MSFCLGIRRLTLRTSEQSANSCYHQLTLADAEARLGTITQPLAFYQNVSPEKELRDASNGAESILRDFEVESSMRLDVFQAKIAAKKNIETSGQWDKLSAEQQRLIEKMVIIIFT